MLEEILQNIDLANDQYSGAAHVMVAEEVPREASQLLGPLDLNEIIVVPSTPAVVHDETTTAASPSAAAQLLHIVSDATSMRRSEKPLPLKNFPDGDKWLSCEYPEVAGDDVNESWTVSQAVTRLLRTDSNLRAHTTTAGGDAQEGAKDSKVSAIWTIILSGLSDDAVLRASCPQLQLLSDALKSKEVSEQQGGVIAGVLSTLDKSNKASLLAGMLLVLKSVACDDDHKQRPVVTSGWLPVMDFAESQRLPVACGGNETFVSSKEAIEIEAISTVTVSEVSSDAHWRFHVHVPKDIVASISVSRGQPNEAASAAQSLAADRSEAAIVMTHFSRNRCEEEKTTQVVIQAGVVSSGASNNVFPNVKLLTSNSPVVEITPTNDLLICGFGPQCIQLVSRARVVIESEDSVWDTHLHHAAILLRDAMAKRIVSSLYGPLPSREGMKPFRVLPLFGGGFRDDEGSMVDDDALMAPLKILCSRLAVRSGDWQESVIGLLFRVLAVHCGTPVASAYLVKRWRIDWVSVLQGAANEATREALANLCRFVLLHAIPSHTNADPAACCTLVKEWLMNRVDPSDILPFLHEQLKNAETAVHVADALFSNVQESEPFLRHWLTAEGAADVMAPFEGAPRGVIQRLQNTLLVALRSCSDEGLASIAQRHRFSPTMLESLLQSERMAAATNSNTDSGVNVSLDCNFVFSNKPGVRVTSTNTGEIEVERTSMGSFCLRAVRAWSLLTTQCFTRYFEVTFGDKNIKRALVGLCAPQDVVDSTDYVHSEVRSRSWYLDSQGKTHCVAFGCGDTVGVGLSHVPGNDTRYFFTLNGVLLFNAVLDVPQTKKGVTMPLESVVPFVTTNTTDRSVLKMNFGEGPFAFDVCSVMRVAKAKYHTRAVDEVLRQACEYPQLHKEVCSVAVRLQRWAPLRCVAEASTLQSRTAKQLLVTLLDWLATSPLAASDDTCLVLDVVSRLIQRGTPLPPSASSQRSFLLQLPSHMSCQTKREVASSRVEFQPWWTAANEEASWIQGNVVHMLEKQYLSHAVGTALPHDGTASFSVYIQSGGSEQKTVKNFGQYYIGVTTATVSDLSTGSWKDASPPTVWAVHSIGSGQLRHCNDAAFAGDNYSFSSNSLVTVEVDRDAGTLSLRRSGKTFTGVFTDIPKGAVLRPFVQIVDEKTSAVLVGGYRTNPFGPSTMLLGSLVHLHRALLSRRETSEVMSAALKDELHACVQAGSLPPLLSATLGITASPRCASVMGKMGEMLHGTVVEVNKDTNVAIVKHNDGAMSSSVPLDLVFLSRVQGNDLEDALLMLSSEHSQHQVELCTSSEEEDEDDLGQDGEVFTTAGYAACVRVAADALVAWERTILPQSLLYDEEARERTVILSEESRCAGEWMFSGSIHMFAKLQQWNNGLMTAVLQAPLTPASYTFNPRASSPGLSIPKHYQGKLILTPSRKSDERSFFAIANEAIPTTGVCNIRLKVELDWMSLLCLDGTVNVKEGFYFGLCSDAFHGELWDLTRRLPPVTWAVPSVDTKAHHLPHSCKEATEAVLIFNKDVIRLQINRERGTMDVYRTPYGRPEVSLGTVYNNLPTQGALFPFVRMPSLSTAVMFLPEVAALPRSSVNAARFAGTIKSKGHTCDGCLQQLVQVYVEAPNWYRCNQCLSYDLCGSCFQNHVHCGHTFTHMRPMSFLPSPVHDRRLVMARGAEVEMPSAPLVPLRVVNGVSESETFHLSVVTTGRMSLMQWGILRRASSVVECTVTVRWVKANRQACCHVLAGIAPLSLFETCRDAESVLDVVKKQPQRCSTYTSCSDWSGANPNPSESTRWLTGDDVTLRLQKDNAVHVLRNGKVVQTSTSQSDGKELLCVFVVVEEEGVQVCVHAPGPGGMALTGKIGEVNTSSSVARVTNGTANRWVAASQLHVPLTPVKQHSVLHIGLQVFVPVKGADTFKECVVTRVGTVDEPISVHDGVIETILALESLFVPQSVNDARDPDDDHMYPDVKRRLRRFYAAHAPTKTDTDMDKAIELYAKSQRGHKGMWEDLVKKYGPEPALDIVLPVNRTSNARMMQLGIEAKHLVPVAMLMKFLLDCVRMESLRTAVFAECRTTLASCMDRLSMLPVVHDVSTIPSSLGDWWSLTLDQLNASDSTRIALQALPTLREDESKGRLSRAISTSHVNPSACDETYISTGEFDGSLRCAKGLVLQLHVDCLTKTAVISFSRGDGTLLRIQYRLQRQLWNTSTQRLTLGFGEADDVRNEAVLFLDSSEPTAPSSRIPLQLRTGESLVCSVYWDAVERSGVGEWRLANGSRGQLTLRRIGEDLAELFVSPQLYLPPVNASCQSVASLVQDLDTSANEASHFLAFAASQMRVWCGADGVNIRVLLQQLSLLLPRVGVRTFVDRVQHLVSTLQHPESLLQEAAVVCCSASTPLPLLRAAVVVLCVVPCRSNDDFAKAANAMAHAAHRNWQVTDVLDSLARLLRSANSDQLKLITGTLNPLHAFLDSLAQGGFRGVTLLSAAAEVFSPIAEIAGSSSTLPVLGVQLLCDVSDSVSNGVALPSCVDNAENSSLENTLQRWTPLGESTRFQQGLLVAGTIVSQEVDPKANGQVYAEITSSRKSRCEIGLCTSALVDTFTVLMKATQNMDGTAELRLAIRAPKYGPMLGFHASSIGYDGTTFFHNGRGKRVGHHQIVGGETLGLLLDGERWEVILSCNGEQLQSIPLPEAWRNETRLRFCMRASSSEEGSTVRSESTKMVSAPPGSQPLHLPVQDCSRYYQSASRSTVPVLSLSEWATVVERAQTESKESEHSTQLRSIVTVAMNTLTRMDYTRDDSRLALCLPIMKRLLHAAQRSSLHSFPLLSVGERSRLPQVAVRWHQLFSNHVRSAEEALEHTVLAQLHRQLGNDATKMQTDPMFVTALSMTESTHTPIDAGGPYSQTWSLVAEEIMTDDTTSVDNHKQRQEGEEAPKDDTTNMVSPAMSTRRFYRNPMFKFGNGSKAGKSLVPDRLRNRPMDLDLFRFLGSLLGYLVRSKRCLALEMSQVVWKFLTEEPLTITDMIEGVDASLSACLDDDALLSGDDAEGTFPGIDATETLLNARNPLQPVTRREAAEYAVIHSMDAQLEALREGMWRLLPRSTTRMMTARELALKVCGEPFPTLDQVKQSVAVSLPEPYVRMFWTAMEGMSPSEWSGFFYFAAAQRRYPLSRKITVTPTKQSEDHIPQASTCFSHVSTPLYSTVEKWKTKLLQAISCQDMELA